MTAINDQQRKAVRNKIPPFLALLEPWQSYFYLFKNIVSYNLNLSAISPAVKNHSSEFWL